MERQTAALAARRQTGTLTTMWFLMVACAAVVLFGATDADATIIDNGWYTTDTTTSLEWADLTLTNGVTWNQMQAGAGHGTYASTGWLNEGWRHATHDEVLGLWTEITGMNFAVAVTSYHAQDVQGMVGALVGNTRYGNTYYGPYRSSYGYVAENVNAYYTHWMGMHHYRHYNHAYGVGLTTNITMNYTYQSGWGHWLVRSSSATVPEPGTLALTALGLFAMGAARRRRATRR